MITRERLIVVGGGLIFVIVTIGGLWIMAVRDEETKRQKIALGSEVYATHCASCHGVDLEGQAGWETPLPDGRMRPPPLDRSGHAGHHSEAELFRIVKRGKTAVSGAPSDMPAFENDLSDEQIEAVLELIKSKWIPQ